VLASGLCGAAQDMLQLIVFRALQGVGGAAIFALTFAIIGDLFPPEKRGYVSGVTSSMWAIAAIVGPALGAVLTETVGWRWVFLLGAIGSFAFGWSVFTLGAFVPLFVRGALGAGVRGAGVALLAQSVSWSVAATLSGAMMRPLGYRLTNLLGFGLMLVGYLLM